MRSASTATDLVLTAVEMIRDGRIRAHVAVRAAGCVLPAAG